MVEIRDSFHGAYSKVGLHHGKLRWLGYTVRKNKAHSTRGMISEARFCLLDFKLQSDDRSTFKLLFSVYTFRGVKEVGKLYVVKQKKHPRPRKQTQQ